MDRQELVTVLTVENPMNAEIIRGALQSAGIPCEIGGEKQGGFAGIGGVGIDILTQAGDAKKARQFLRQLRHDTRLRRQKRAETKRAKAEAAEHSQEAIQELNKPSEDIRQPPASDENVGPPQ
jgi:Putative prokaryotic signal transducing protein